MKRRIKIYTVLAYVFAGLQLLNYLGQATSANSAPSNAAERTGYYAGMHIFAIIAVLLFIAAFRLRKKMKNAEADNMVDSIGDRM